MQRLRDLCFCLSVCHSFPSSFSLAGLVTRGGLFAAGFARGSVGWAMVGTGSRGRSRYVVIGCVFVCSTLDFL